jgi:hypothetical protein
MKGGSVAAVLLLVGAQREYAWPLFAPEIQGQVWNIGGAVAILALLLMLDRSGWPMMAWAVAIWFAAEELLVVACSAAWIVSPWEVAAGEEQCTGRVGFKLGSIGIVILAWLAWKVAQPVNLSTTQDPRT